MHPLDPLDLLLAAMHEIDAPYSLETMPPCARRCIDAAIFTIIWRHKPVSATPAASCCGILARKRLRCVCVPPQEG
jgi:hypothetical protein